MSMNDLVARGVVIVEDLENKGIMGYDYSPEVIAQGQDLQRRLHQDFLKMLDNIQKN